MSSPFFQSVDPAATPPETPGSGPADAAGWDQVTPSGTGPAAYDISAPQDIASITAAASAAQALTGGSEGAPTGAGLADMHSPRQSEAAAFLGSPQGYGAVSITTGFPDYESTDVSPGANLETPIQGAGTYPGTTQDGISQYGMGGGIPGVTPETGSMDDSSAVYPGTTQDGVTKYGTS